MCSRRASLSLRSVPRTASSVCAAAAWRQRTRSFSSEVICLRCHSYESPLSAVSIRTDKCPCLCYVSVQNTFASPGERMMGEAREEWVQVCELAANVAGFEKAASPSETDQRAAG